MKRSFLVVMSMVATLMFNGAAWADEPIYEHTQFTRGDIYLGYYGVLDSEDSASGATGWAQARIWLIRLEKENRPDVDLGFYLKGSVGSGDYNTDGYTTDADNRSFGGGVSLQVSRDKKYVLTADLGYEGIVKETSKDKEYGNFSSEQEDSMLYAYANYADFRRRASGHRWLPKTTLEAEFLTSLSEDYSGEWNGEAIADLDGFDPGLTKVLVRQYIVDLGKRHRLSPALAAAYTFYAESDRENCASIGASLAYSFIGEERIRADFMKKLGDDEATSLAVIMSLDF